MRSSMLILLALALVAIPLFDEAQAAEKTWEDWNFVIDLNLQLLNVSGEAVVTLPWGSPVEVPVDLPFRDLVDNYKGGVMGNFMAKKKRWSINLDVFYAKLEGEQSVTLPFLEDTPYAISVNSTNTMTVGEYEMFLGYQVSEPDQGASEIIFGARYINQELSLESDVSVGESGTEPLLDESADNSWWMGFIGARHVGPLAGSETLDLIVRADVGAFDTSGRLTWRTDLGTRWQFANHWHLSFMYKWMGIDYQKDDSGDPEFYRYEAVEHGPIIGIGVNF